MPGSLPSTVTPLQPRGDGHAVFWQYSDSRLGNVAESLFQGLASQTDLQGNVTKLTDALTNSPDVFQLEAWSGGPVPPGVVP